MTFVMYSVFCCLFLLFYIVFLCCLFFFIKKYGCKINFSTFFYTFIDN